MGQLVKQANRFRCQLCAALELEPIAFKKTNGEPYVEAHHVMPVSMEQAGSLSVSNIMILCANHHRQMHYGNVSVAIDGSQFHVTVDGRSIRVARTRPSDPSMRLRIKTSQGVVG
jgi:predicted restriction endonuclease